MIRKPHFYTIIIAIACLGLFTLLSINAASAAQVSGGPAIQWEKTYLASKNASDHIYDCHVNYINRTADGNYLIVGKQTDYPASDGKIVAGTILNRFLVLKVASDGALLWNQTIDAGGNAEAVKFIQDRDGNYLIIGTAYAGANPGVVMVKMDNAGNLLWKKTISTADSYARDVIQTSDGGYVIAENLDKQRDYMNFGTIIIPTNDIGLIKVDKDGNVQWEKRYESIVDDSANKVIETPDGYLVVGDTNSYDDQGRARPANYFDTTKSMGMDLTATYNFYLLKVGPGGDKVWSKAFGGKGFDSATDVIASGDGNYIVAGVTDAGRNYTYPSTNVEKWTDPLMDACLLKIAPDGSLAWEKTYGSNDRFYINPIVTPAGDGGYLVLATVEAYDTGERSNATDGKRPISEAIKTDASGLLQWSVPLRCREAAVDRGAAPDKWLITYYHGLGGGTLYCYSVASPGGGYLVTGIDEGSHPALVRFADTSSAAVVDNGGSGGLPWLYIAALVVLLVIAAGALICFKNKQKGKK